MAKPRRTPEEKAQAVAQVLAGESRRAVADELGISEGTVRRWMAEAARRGTAQEKRLAADAETIADRIKAKQEQARELLLDRILALAPDSASLKDIATAFGIVTDKHLLAQGKPTSIHAAGLALPDGADMATLEHAADELHRRRQEVTAA